MRSAIGGETTDDVARREVAKDYGRSDCNGRVMANLQVVGYIVPAGVDLARFGRAAEVAAIVISSPTKSFSCSRQSTALSTFGERHFLEDRESLRYSRSSAAFATLRLANFSCSRQASDRRDSIVTPTVPRPSVGLRTCVSATDNKLAEFEVGNRNLGGTTGLTAVA